MAKKDNKDRLSKIALKPVEISAELPNNEQGNKKGLKVNRLWTKADQDVYETVQWDTRESLITDEKGNIVSHISDIKVPTTWSQLATDILAYKYFRKAGLKTPEGREVSAKQTIYRIVHSFADFGEKFNYFASKEDRASFEDELAHLLLNQKAAFNSPVWFNVGLYHQYGIKGQGGSFYWDFKKEQVIESESAYRNPQCSACFILSVQDTLPAIFDLIKTESHIFKYGSGSGANFSKLRSRYERLSGGGVSSGMMSFLRVFDRAAGATKSGGTTRRAAKMVVVDITHPEIEDFIEWKVKEEKKAQVLIDAGYERNFNGEAYSTVSGQNSNNSVRITDEFMKAVESDGEWQTRLTTTNEPHKTFKARQLMDKIAQAAWQCADPGVQFDTTVNEWHTCPNTDRINASNPCVTGDALVATADGWRRIDSLVGQSAKIIGADGNAHFVDRIFPTGTKEVFELETKTGLRLRLTADHRVLTTQGDVAAKDLQPGMSVVLGGAGFGREVLSDGIGLAIGAAVGDGCLVKSNIRGKLVETITTVMARAEAPILAKIASSINELKQDVSVTDGRSRKSLHLGLTQGNTTRLAFGDRRIVDLFKRYAFLGEGAAQKRFSDEIHRLDKPSLAAILRGLFTADGTVANYGDKSQYVSLDSASSRLLEQTQLLLLNFGIKSKIYANRRGGNTTTSSLPDGKGGFAEYNVQETHSLRISRSSRFIFQREIGFDENSAKQTALDILNAQIGAYRDEMTDLVSTIKPVGLAPVFDLTESVTKHFVANGLIVHNCSEYMFLDDSACNLASINLVKFVDENGQFDVEGYRHACRVIFIAQEIAVDFSAYPTANIAKNSHDYRPLGLGYANLGTLLMLWGVPYDSPKGYAIAGALTAILCGHAFRTSAEMAAVKGPFAGFLKNRAPMINVMKKHRSFAYKIDDSVCPANILEAAKQDWDEAVALGEQFGYRNSQATVIAPTGTIGLLMDCDTTGVEPDFALVKFKKLAGGGSIKIVNHAVKKALSNLGYTDEQQTSIIEYALGSGRFVEHAPINRSSLKAKGLTDSEMDSVEKTLGAAFDISYSFNKLILGEDIYRRLNIGSDETEQAGFSMLQRLGFSDREIIESNEIICGTQMLEGAPELKDEHLAVFDCANRCGINGTRYIAALAHVRMMAAVQPFISGAISKTINMPNEATVEDVKEVYIESWKSGLKALALYRDGSKSSQPLNTKKEEDEKKVVEVEKIVEKIVYAPKRRRLSDERRSITHKFNISGHKGYLTVGLFEDGKPGEIFITMAKQGSVISGLMDAFAMSVSIALQYGVPLSILVRKFINSRFEPYGFTTNPQIRIAKSILDYIARYLGIKFLSPEDQLEYGIKADSESTTSQTELGLNVKQEVEDSAMNTATEEANDSDVDEAATSSSEPKAAVKKPQTDSPLCANCGSMTFKTGTCYTCLSCGSTTGGCS